MLPLTSIFFRNKMRFWKNPDAVRIIELEWDDPKSFEMYCRWIHKKPCMALEPDAILLKSWMLGDLLQDCDFQDQILSRLINKVQSSDTAAQKFMQDLGPSIVNDIFGSLSHGTPLARFLVDCFVQKGLKEDIMRIFEPRYRYAEKFRNAIADSLAEMKGDEGKPRDGISHDNSYESKDGKEILREFGYNHGDTEDKCSASGQVCSSESRLKRWKRSLSQRSLTSWMRSRSI